MVCCLHVVPESSLHELFRTSGIRNSNWTLGWIIQCGERIISQKVGSLSWCNIPLPLLEKFDNTKCKLRVIRLEFGLGLIWGGSCYEASPGTMGAVESFWENSSGMCSRSGYLRLGPLWGQLQRGSECSRENNPCSKRTVKLCLHGSYSCYTSCTII